MTKEETKKTNRLLAEQNALLKQQAAQPAAPATNAAPTAPPPGWYEDPEGKTRWWDGTRWGEHVKP